MLNININGETVTIKEQTALKDLIAVDCYPVEQDNRIALPIPQDLNLPKDIDKINLYVAGIVIADTKGFMETITDEIIYEGLKWEPEWNDYFGVYVIGNFTKYDNATGIKIYFGRC